MPAPAVASGTVICRVLEVHSSPERPSRAHYAPGGVNLIFKPVLMPALRHFNAATVLL